MELETFKIGGYNHCNKVYIQVAVNIAYKDHKAVQDGHVGYSVYDTMEKTFDGRNTGPYKYFWTASKAASRANTILKRAGYTGAPIKYSDLTRVVDDLLRSAQYKADRIYHEERVAAFKKEFAELLQKHNMHIRVEETGDYYTDWNVYSIIDDTVNKKEVYLDDIVDEIETTEKA